MGNPEGEVELTSDQRNEGQQERERERDSQRRGAAGDRDRDSQRLGTAGERETHRYLEMRQQYRDRESQR